MFHKVTIDSFIKIQVIEKLDSGYRQEIKSYCFCILKSDVLQMINNC
jgi:hypothetical protein